MRKVRDEGFTLIELLVAMTIGLVVMAGVSMTFRSQQRSHLIQEQVAATQQNLRAAMYHMEREIRMAGCDPTFGASAQIVNANANAINFTMDVRGAADGSPPDGTTTDPDENITYSLSGSDLIRNGAGNIVAENISALDFVYLRQDGTVLNPGGGNVLAADIPNIKSVEITMVARTARSIKGYIDTLSYENQHGTEILAPPNDNFRRICLTTRIKCRNL
jgi:prepilin-type N-terminal cleavage/methylation domain-containing protein